MKDTLISIKAKLSAISLKSHRNGYDFNADPEKITLLEGEIFEALDKLIASQPTVQADAVCRCNSETYEQCAFYDGHNGCVHPPRTA